jgi:hypothetical protein
MEAVAMSEAATIGTPASAMSEDGNFALVEFVVADHAVFDKGFDDR